MLDFNMKANGKTILLTETNSDDWFLAELQKNNFDAFVIFKQVPKFFRLCRRIWIKSNLPFQHIWYAKQWKKHVKHADIVIVYVNSLVAKLPQYINQLNPNATVIAWYWNCVEISISPSKIKGNCEKWSFDPNDCEKYGMKFNHQFYFKSLIQKKNVLLYDIYFCGSDVGRGEKLTLLYNDFCKCGLKVLFQIVHPEYEGIPPEIKSPKISYQTMLDNVAKSRCLLEITRKGQTGPTLRLMEALFNKKKVITTNSNVIYEPFYNPQNIFIIGERPLDELRDFVKSDYVDFTTTDIEKYDIKNWLNFFMR